MVREKERGEVISSPHWFSVGGQAYPDGPVLFLRGVYEQEAVRPCGVKCNWHKRSVVGRCRIDERTRGLMGLSGEQ
jgi:hypothetical protein